MKKRSNYFFLFNTILLIGFGIAVVIQFTLSSFQSANTVKTNEADSYDLEMVSEAYNYTNTINGVLLCEENSSWLLILKPTINQAFKASFTDNSYNNKLLWRLERNQDLKSVQQGFAYNKLQVINRQLRI